MATPGADFATLARKATDNPTPRTTVEAELRELENQIVSHRDRPLSTLLEHVIERVGSITLANGAAIAVRDDQGVICQASLGEAPEVGSRLGPDSALTRECFETGQIVVCKDTETDYRVRRSTAKSLRLRSAVIVPLQTQGAVLGVIEVLSSRPSAFNEAQVAALVRIGKLLAQLLAAAPAQPLQFEPKGSVLADIPAEVQEAAESGPAPISTSAPRKKLDPRLNAFAVSVAVLLLLSLVFYFAVIRSRQVGTSSAPAIAPASAPKIIAEPATSPEANPPDERRVQRLDPGASSNGLPSGLRSHPPASSASAPSSLAGAESTAAMSRKSSMADSAVAETQAPGAIRPAVAAFIVQGAPPGAQVFIDDQLIASTDRAGHASIPMLSAGQHRLRLKGAGYQDYDQSVDVQAGKTPAITAKLKPLDPPVLSGPSIAPVLPIAPAIPAPVISNRTSPPDFVLDRTLKAHNGWVTSIAFSPDGQRLASGSWDRTVKFWRVSTGEQLSTVTGKMKEVEALTFSHDGNLLATENSSNTATLRDAATGQEIRAFASDKLLGLLGSNWIYSIAFSPNGQWLASGIDDKTVRLWDVKTGRRVRDLTGLRRSVIYIAFSPDGRYLATGGDEKTIEIWDPASGERIYKLIGHKKLVYAAAFSSNGRWVASASADKTVKLWDLTSGREVHTLAGHGNAVTSLAFSPDGRWLVSGSWDKTIKIWDVETGREVQTLAGHDRPIYSIAFDSQGRWLASGSEDGTIKLWRFADSADQSGLRR
jgi:WD40 repeat protein/GAF domain-containing protein